MITIQVPYFKIKWRWNEVKSFNRPVYRLSLHRRKRYRPRPRFRCLQVTLERRRRSTSVKPPLIKFIWQFDEPTMQWIEETLGNAVLIHPGRHEPTFRITFMSDTDYCLFVIAYPEIFS